MRASYLQHWNHQLRHWCSMFAGTSYYHQPQGMGRAFVADDLKGYFNDLTGKANWRGKLDKNGLPFNTLTNGKPVYFPVVLCQKALGHWDLWLLNQREEDRQQFLKIATWLQQTQDTMGGWDTWGPLGQPEQYRYSAMTQGEAVSTMVRAYVLTNDNIYAAACKRGIDLMRRPVLDGGVSCLEAEDVFLEEFPGATRDTVLNGWIFALFGIHDYLLRIKDDEAKAFYERTRASLVRCLRQFDSGFWSYYSSGTKRMASPFYHDLHLSQLQALRQVTTDPSVRSTLDAWTSYRNNKYNQFRALLVKGVQKLKEPAEFTIVD